ncbi:Four and a half LIM domains protein 2 [Labeo rohita]|uniref:Four and a half LIM domains protein 2 n=1 Tax=Labeo rohita TaxID=84645 RepID=A0ABQ8MKK8_LABRO|nr:Four and a half LIM domains protein 2 [Labeo rohita]
MTERYDCHYCKESLFGKKYVLRDENPYCVKCYESLYSNTLSHYMVISPDEEAVTSLEDRPGDLSYKDRHWHDDCFHCFKCHRSLVDKPFSTKDEQLLCTECYSNEYSSKCFECKKTIMPGSRKMEHKGNSWHETCFTCQRCQQPIGTKSFIPKDNSNYCVACYEKQFALQCVHCKKPITTGGVTYHDQPWHKDCFLCTGCLGGSKYISFEERQWHNDCFNCKKCLVSLVGRGFLTERDDILCPDCGKDI